MNCSCERFPMQNAGPSLSPRRLARFLPSALPWTQFNPQLSSSISSTLHLFTLSTSPSYISHNAQEASTIYRWTQLVISWVWLGLYSAITRPLRASAFRRSATVQRAFQPIKSNFAPALSARFASTDSARDGKIHQVIGAVVDGTRKLFPLGPAMEVLATHCRSEMNKEANHQLQWNLILSSFRR